jgi:hypothetical protein
MALVYAQRRSLPVISAIFYLSLVIILFFSIEHKTHGVFVYALDDPYIHLAMAEQLAHGHYGINASEPSSPSSSILWPVLLIPFSGTALHTYVPLFWNVIFGAAAAALLGMFVSYLPLDNEDQRGRTSTRKVFLACLLVLVANLPSLTLLGMEHVLQVLLTICCALAIVSTLERKSVPVWALAAAVIGPSVRYENLAITVAVAIALIGLKEWKKAAGIVALSIVPLIAFSAFLKSQGLPILPVSVLMKRGIDVNPMIPNPGTVGTLLFNLRQDVTSVERLSMTLLFVLILVLLWRTRERLSRYALTGTLLVAGAQLTIGKFGWFHRYQVYSLVFVVLIVLWVAMQIFRPAFPYIVAALLFCAAPFIAGTYRTPSNSAAIFDQQYQMHRFVAEFFRKSVAVNDLGLVSYRRPADIYVLDVYGLASPEVARQKDRSAEWLDGLLQRRQISMAIIYPEWFNIPEEWRLLAQMCRPRMPGTTGRPCVDFYNTSAATYEFDREDLQRFAKTLPGNLSITLTP